jgi:hypothetical protein
MKPGRDERDGKKAGGVVGRRAGNGDSVHSGSWMLLVVMLQDFTELCGYPI